MKSVPGEEGGQVSEPIRVGRLVRRVARKLMESSAWGFRMSMRLRGYSGSPRRPDTPWMNRVLKEPGEYEHALATLRELGLIPHPDGPKNWDFLGTLDFILKHTGNRARILDAGGETYSPLVEWLFAYGYRLLHVINLSFKRDFKRGSIRYIRGDCTATPYPPDYFDVITCLSVIEHGVDLKAFVRECLRILRPGGFLVVSTDFWEEPIDTSGKTAYGVPVKVFTEADIQEVVASSASQGLTLTGPIDYSVGSKVVHWESAGLDFSFILFALQKEAAAPSRTAAPTAKGAVR